jgi:hypothetical protein
VTADTWAALREAARRLRAAAQRRRGRRELDEEMRFHLEMLEREYTHAGMSPAAARDAARRRFGNALALRERSEDVWRWPGLDSVLQDLRFGARLLRRSPAFAAVAVGAIGVAMAVNCGVFTLVDALVWRPLPVRDPASLVMLHPVDERGATGNLLSYPEFAAVRADARARVAPVGDFVLVHVTTPLAECERRDRKGLYARARAGEIPDFVGIAVPYETPADADVTVDTTGRTVQECADELWAWLEDRGHASRPEKDDD